MRRGKRRRNNEQGRSQASVPQWLVSSLLGVLSLVLALTICVATRLIPKWGQWYSANPAFRRQTEAMLQGSLALDDDPRTLGYDMAWTDSGVQQVWGLGISSWRLPFEGLTKLFGYAGFPDRLALAVAMALLIYALLRLLVLPPSERGLWARIRQHPEALAGALLLILFPPFLALCRTRFDVYEEVQAYTYLAGLALFAITLWFIQLPTFARYLMLALASGLAAFVRPTLFFYGLASLVLAWGVTQWRGWPQARSWAGPALFCLGGALLFFSNVDRFGSGFEFGHQLNANVFFPMMYATRFENPIYDAPLSARVAELFSYLFLVRDHLSCCDGYAARVLPWQASVVRWRDIYFSTYDLSLFALTLAAWAASLVLSWRAKFKFSESLNKAALMGLWSFLCALPLVLLYLSYPVMSSRYMMDFAAAFAVAIWVVLQLSCQLIRRKFPARHRVIWLPILLLTAWWSYQVATTRIFLDTGGGTVAQVRLPKAPHGTLVPISLASYTRPMNTDYDIPFNGYGWHPNGSTASIIVLFLSGAQRIELDVRPKKGRRVDQRDWDQIRVKIGLEELRLESSKGTPEGRKLTFARDAKPADPAQIEVAFIAMTSASKSSHWSKFKLLSVRWRDDVSY